MIFNIKKLNPHKVSIMFFVALFVFIFSIMFNLEHSIISKNKLSSSVMTVNSLSQLIKADIRLTIVETLRAVNFAEDRRYNEEASKNNAFLYSIMINKFKEILERNTDIDKISLFRNGKIEVENKSKRYINEKYKTLGNISIVFDEKVVHLKILKGLFTERIIIASRSYASDSTIRINDRGTYLEVYNEIDLEKYYSEMKIRESSIIVTGKNGEIEKYIGRKNEEYQDVAIKKRKDDNNNIDINIDIDISNLISEIEYSKEIENGLIICGFKIFGKVEFLYVDKIKKTNLEGLEVIKLFLICLFIIVIVISYYYLIKNIYIDREIKRMTNKISDALSNNYKKVSQSTPDFRYEKSNKLNDVIEILINSHLKNKDAIKEFRNKDALTMLPNENKLKDEIEIHKKIKRENTYLGTFYIKPSENMIKATMTTISPYNSLYTIISDEIISIIEDFKSNGFGTAKLFRTSNESFSIIAITDSRSNFKSLCAHIVESISKDRFEKNINFFTSCFCGWTYLDFNNEIKSNYGLSINKTIEFAISKGVFVQEFNSEIKDIIQKEDDLKFDIQNSIVNGDFSILYQPVFSTKKYLMNGVHVYPVWNHNLFGEIRYNEFMPILEKIRKAEQLQNWFIDESFRGVNEWRKGGYRTLNIFIRISQVQMASKDIVNYLIRSAEINSIKNENINILLDASTFELNSKIVIRNIERLSTNKFKISINNYGLKINNPSIISFSKNKINRVVISSELIEEAKKNNVKDKIVESISVFCKNFNTIVSCNAIEDIDLAKTLANNGVDEISGNCIARPMNEHEIILFFDKNIKNRIS